jgi:hypothetical protein
VVYGLVGGQVAAEDGLHDESMFWVVPVVVDTGVVRGVDQYVAGLFDSLVAW